MSSSLVAQASVPSRALMLALVLLASSCIPGMVLGGGVFELAKPVFPNNDDYKLLFKAPPPKDSNKPPAVLKALVSPFLGNILQQTVVTIEPCGVIGAHEHPRGTEHQYIIHGHIEVGMFLEDRTTRFVNAKPGEGIVIPQGAIHYVRNTGCKKATFLVTFDHPTAGAVFAGEALLSFPEDFLKSAFGYSFKGPAPNLFFSKICKCENKYGDKYEPKHEEKPEPKYEEKYEPEYEEKPEPKYEEKYEPEYEEKSKP